MAVDIHNGYYFDCKIKGVSHYFDTIKKCYNDPKAYKKGKSAFVDVALIFENDNPYDEMAVYVLSDHGKIGYLSRNIARKYRQDYQNGLTIRAKIYTQEPDQQQIFSVSVDLDYDDTPPRKPRKKSTPTPANDQPITLSEKKPPDLPEPMKPWKEMDRLDKITFIITIMILLLPILGVMWLAWVIITWIF